MSKLPRTIPNIGSTCYMNCVFQLLFVVEDFRKTILNLCFIDDSFLYYFQLIFKYLNNELDIDKEKLKTYLQVFKSYCETYASAEQEDASHFLMFLLEKLNKEIKQKIGNNYDICDLFRGKQTYETTCLKCKDMKRNKQTFLVLQLRQSKNSDKIENLLNSLSQMETIKDTECYFCGCQQMSLINTVEEWPQYLIINLSKIKYQKVIRLVKMHRNVKIPHLKFNVPSKTICDECEDGSIVNCSRDHSSSLIEYNVIGTVNHSGIAYFGHYTATVLSYEWDWLVFNDDNVTSTDSKLVVNKDNILLLCKRR